MEGASSTCALKLLLDASLSKAVIGAGGRTVQRLKAESGCHSIRLSTYDPKAIDRTCSIVGPLDTVLDAYRRVDHEAQEQEAAM